MKGLKESLENYNGMPADELKHIPEISFYNHNYYIGLKRDGCVVNDLVFAKSDDKDSTEYYLIQQNQKPIYFGYSVTGVDETIHTDLDF